MAYYTIPRRVHTTQRPTLGLIPTAVAPAIATSGPAAPIVAAAIGIASLAKPISKAFGWPARRARANRQEDEAQQRGVSYECIRQRDASWAAGLPFIPCQGPGDQQQLCAQAAAQFGVRCSGDAYKCKTPAGPACTYERVGGPWPNQAVPVISDGIQPANYTALPGSNYAVTTDFQQTSSTPNWLPWAIGGAAGIALIMAATK